MLRSFLRPTTRQLISRLAPTRSQTLLYSQAPTPKCPSCSRPLPTSLPACPTCAYISALPAQFTYHELFGLPSEPNPFRVDAQILKERFRRAQAVCHPDAWASKGSRESDLAHALSSHINRGYIALSGPLERAEYILGLHDERIAETDNLNDPDFITSILDVRSEVDEAELERVVEIDEENRRMISETIEDIQRFVGEKEWSSVKDAAIRLKFLLTVEAAIKERLRNG